MKFSYNWLKELSGTGKSPKELADLFTAKSFEVEEFGPYQHGLQGVVVGEVLSAELHPDADRLKVTVVRTCEGEERTIVCGAPNVAVGQKVLVALPGTNLPNGARIEESVIRGVASSGMICAEDELEMGVNHEGILVLPDDATIGTPAADLFELEDTVFDIKVLPNRGTDALSHFGLAREIAALEGRSFVSKYLFDEPFASKPSSFVLRIDASQACGAYLGLSFALPDTSKQIPLSMVGKLLVLGSRSIHPAADIANYLMLLFGQPMHAFDADTLSGSEIIVRFANEGEKILLLHDEEVSLTSDDLVIADESGPIALAGIMGGKASAVSPSTRRVFFEMANFDPKSIRTSRIRHGLATDAAYFFEHAVDVSWPERLRGEVADAFTALLGAEFLGNVEQLPKALPQRTLEMPVARIEELLGVAVSEEQVMAILKSLSIDAKIHDGVLSVSIPSFRPDIEKEADIIEEIGRIYGYEQIAPVVPMLPSTAGERNQSVGLKRRVKELLANRGWNEIQTYSFYGVSSARLSGVPLSGHFLLETPMNPDQEYLRTFLLPTMLEKVLENITRAETIRLFEMGNVYESREGVPHEETNIAFGFVSKERTNTEAFFTLKGEVERFFSSLRIPPVTFRAIASAPSIFHPGRVALIGIGDEQLGMIGEAHPEFSRKFGSRKIVLAQVSMPMLQKYAEQVWEMTPLPKFPFVLRDLSLSIPEAVAASDLEKVVRGAAGPFLRSLEIFDVYQKDGRKSVAFHLAFGADERTISSDEGEEIFQGVVLEAGKQLGAALPS